MKSAGRKKEGPETASPKPGNGDLENCAANSPAKDEKNSPTVKEIPSDEKSA